LQPSKDRFGTERSKPPSLPLLARPPLVDAAVHLTLIEVHGPEAVSDLKSIEEDVMHKWFRVPAIFCCALLLVSAAGADEMTFSLYGQGLDASGAFYGLPNGDGQWLVNDASGVFNGSNIVGIWPESNSGNTFSFDNLFFSPGPAVDAGGIVFQLANGDMVNLCYDSGCAGAAETYTAILWDPVSGISNLNVDSAEFGSPVPEPSTLALMGSGIIGLAGVGRRALLA
jgi:hypothetical protein